MIWRFGALAVTAGLAFTAGLVFQRVFGLGPVLPVAAVAAAVPTLLAALLAARPERPAPLWLSLLLSVVAWVGTVALTVLRPTLSEGTFPSAVRDGVFNSWKAVLTTLPPVPAEPRLLVLVSVLVWPAAAASAEIVLRTGWRLTPVLPPLAVFGTALLLGVDGPGSTAVPLAVTAALAVALVVLRAPTAATGAGRWAAARPLLTGVPVAAAVGAAAFAAVPLVPVGSDPYDPRQRVEAPPPQTRDSVSPLDRVAGWLLADQVMFTVRGRPADKVADQRLVALDRFDGITWSSTARFVPTGGRVPEPDTDVPRTTFRQTVTIAELPGVWAPAADRPRRVDGLRVVTDPVSGVLAAAEPLRRGMTYTVESRVPRWEPEELPGLAVAGDAEARAALELPWGPGATRAPAQLAEFGTFAQRATDGATGPFERASRLAAFLRTHARHDLSAPPGHGYRQLDHFLGVGKRGTSEQFAAAYAVLGRTLGLPTRVVVGFRPAEPRDGIVEVRSRDVMVWPEVKFEGVGWVPFNPLPDRSGRTKRSQVAAGETQKLEKAQQDAASRRRGGDGGGTPPVSPPARPASADESLPAWVLPVAGGVALVVAYLSAVLLVPVRRRRRRRGGSPATRVDGAWAQLLEYLADAGLTDVRALTAHDVAEFAARRVGADAADRVRPLADLVNAARFGQGVIAQGRADEAWGHVDAVRRAVAERSGRARRILRRLHPRVLRVRPRGRAHPVPPPPDTGSPSGTRRKLPRTPARGAGRRPGRAAGRPSGRGAARRPVRGTARAPRTSGGRNAEGARKR